MPNYRIIGKVVERIAPPRFRITLAQQDDGSWSSVNTEWIDAPAGANANEIAKYMREAGDYFTENRRQDWIRETVIGRAAELGMNARMIRDATGDAIAESHMRDYLRRRADICSSKLSAVLRALQLTVVREGQTS